MRRLFHLLLVFLLLVIFVVGSGTGAVRSQSTPEENHLYLPALPNGSGQQSASAAEAVVTNEIGEKEAQFAEEYWTREKFLAAEQVEPMALPLLDESSQPAGSDDNQPTPNGPEGFIPGELPAADSQALAQDLYPQDWANIADMPADMPMEEEDDPLAPSGYDYPAPYTGYCAGCFNSMWTSYPWRAMGKLFFTIPGKGNYVCSASVASNRAIWTAGHCVYSPELRKWHTNMVFVPAYRNGDAPFGTFAVFSQSALSGWTAGSSNANAYDIAMLAVRDRAGRKVSSWVGSLGFTYNLRTDQHFNAFGYPANLKSGLFLMTCQASTARLDTRFRPSAVGIGCNMEGGSSGGPWLVRFNPYVASNSNFVNGVVSYGYTNRRGEFYASYFGSGALNLYNWGRVK